MTFNPFRIQFDISFAAAASNVPLGCLASVDDAHSNLSYPIRDALAHCGLLLTADR